MATATTAAALAAAAAMTAALGAPLPTEGSSGESGPRAGVVFKAVPEELSGDAAAGRGARIGVEATGEDDSDGEGWDVVGHSRMKVEVDAPPDVLDELLAP